LHARKALELDPRSGKAYARLGDGLALEGDGKKEEAKEAYKKAVGLLEGGLMKSGESTFCTLRCFD
jgi:Flp pilus assembly protein TadD